MLGSDKEKKNQLSDSAKEKIKQVMLQQEHTFRHQVRELHRVYWTQISIMRELSHKAECRTTEEKEVSSMPCQSRGVNAINLGNLSLPEGSKGKSIDVNEIPQKGFKVLDDEYSRNAAKISICKNPSVGSDMEMSSSQLNIASKMASSSRMQTESGLVPDLNHLHGGPNEIPRVNKAINSISGFKVPDDVHVRNAAKISICNDPSIGSEMGMSGSQLNIVSKMALSSRMHSESGLVPDLNHLHGGSCEVSRGNKAINSISGFKVPDEKYVRNAAKISICNDPSIGSEMGMSGSQLNIASKMASSRRMQNEAGLVPDLNHLHGARGEVSRGNKAIDSVSGFKVSDDKYVRNAAKISICNGPSIGSEMGMSGSQLNIVSKMALSSRMHSESRLVPDLNHLHGGPCEVSRGNKAINSISGFKVSDDKYVRNAAKIPICNDPSIGSEMGMSGSQLNIASKMASSNRMHGSGLVPNVNHVHGSPNEVSRGSKAINYISGFKVPDDQYFRNAAKTPICNDPSIGSEMGMSGSQLNIASKMVSSSRMQNESGLVPDVNHLCGGPGEISRGNKAINSSSGLNQSNPAASLHSSMISIQKLLSSSKKVPIDLNIAQIGEPSHAFDDPVLTLPPPSSKSSVLRHELLKKDQGTEFATEVSASKMPDAPYPASITSGEKSTNPLFHACQEPQTTEVLKINEDQEISSSKIKHKQSLHEGNEEDTVGKPDEKIPTGSKCDHITGSSGCSSQNECLDREVARAAEALVAISFEKPSYSDKEPSVIETKEIETDHHEYSSDSFEGRTMKLSEIKCDEPSIPRRSSENEAGPSGVQSRGRGRGRGQARRGTHKNSLQGTTPFSENLYTPIRRRRSKRIPAYR